MSVFDGSMVVVALLAALWWALSRQTLRCGATISVADMTAMTWGMISAFVGPALGVKNAPSLDQILALHPTIRSDRRLAAEAP